MLRQEFIEQIESNPVIAAIKDDAGLERCLETDISVIFVLYGDVCSITDIVKRIKDAGKTVVVHVDLINGLSSKEISLDYIKAHTDADGIITTKPNLIRHAKELGLNTILRFFMLDTIALQNVEKQSHSDVQPDIIEVLPGILLPEFFEKIRRISRVRIMASGLISSKEEVLNALNNGVISISTTNQKIWEM
ncbi:glycerol-3-phosphate responsive antiterminator [Oribacterium sp. WCC10]|uniref:glycerol-3-phosphate responsive antiterminator n=1 Tax=Oribacterium sp. WCC10 TaxID=1855343 RepID=UPI0008E4DB63|nr:glycerol-3-phosphate responsive antiterminator [Oribacterium sp. WCC10]SFG48925.1 Glycerol-3-phosphate responsive antiterminator (mRNA-binding) [Oribacterium sp. WCC10]